MPTYEYNCETCQKEFETEQSIKSESIADCPVCGTTSKKRLISMGTNFLLKGGGWAADNYSSKK